MKNAIKVGKFLQMLKDSTWESDYPQLYAKYYYPIEALLRGFNDCTLEGLSSLEGLTDSSKFASFIRFETLEGESKDSKERAVDNRFSAILAEITTWHDEEVELLQKNRATIKKAIDRETISKWATIVSAIFTLVLGPVALHFGMSHDEIAFYCTGGSAIITLVVSAIAGICNRVQNNKFHSIHGISIAKAKSLIITEEEYKEKIQQARQLYLTKHYRGNIRKAKRIYNKLLKRDSTDPNCLVGLLALLSDNFTKYSSRRKEDNLIEDIEASKGDDNYLRLDNDYKKDYKNYKEKKVTPYKDKQNQNQTRKNEQHCERVAHAISVWQQIGICAVLLLPTLLSSAVLVLVYCLPVKTFDDWMGWLFTIIFALDCLSVIAVIVLWIVLSVADRNPDIIGFGLGAFGVIVAVFGLYGGIELTSSIYMPYWLTILMAVVYLAVWLTFLIWGLVDTFTCKRRLLLVCICSVLFGCALFSGSWTLSEFEAYYTENPDGTYTYHILDENVENLQIPSEYQGKSVTAISRADNVDLSHLKSVFIPASVTSIEFGAFSGSSALTNITVPYVGYYNIAGVTDYDGEAETLRPIGYLFGASPYSGGVATEQHYWGKFLSGDKAGEESEFFKTFYIPESLKHITILGGEVCNGAFYSCTNLESVTLGDGVTAIGEYAFQDCTSLASVVIGKGVTTIGIDAFLNCNAVQKNKGILYVDHWVVGCDNTVTEAELSNDVTGIANYAFANFASLTSVILNEKLKIIGEGAFQRTGITTMVIPQSVAGIGANAFSRCALSEVVFENVDEWYADKTYVPYSDLLDATKAANCLTLTYVECVWQRG